MSHFTLGNADDNRCNDFLKNVFACRWQQGRKMVQKPGKRGLFPAPGEQVVEELDLTSYMVDYDFIPTLGIDIIKGRNFSRSFNDSTSVLLNEEAVQQIGWKNPVGQWIKYPGGNDVMFQVIGVIRNFYVESMHIFLSKFNRAM